MRLIRPSSLSKIGRYMHILVVFSWRFLWPSFKTLCYAYLFALAVQESLATLLNLPILVCHLVDADVCSDVSLTGACSNVSLTQTRAVTCLWHGHLLFYMCSLFMQKQCNCVWVCICAVWPFLSTYVTEPDSYWVWIWLSLMVRRCFWLNLMVRECFWLNLIVCEYEFGSAWWFAC